MRRPIDKRLEESTVTDPTTAEVRRMVQSAFPRPEPSETLQQRVAAIYQHPEAAPSGERQEPSPLSRIRNGLAWLSFGHRGLRTRWGWSATAVAVLAALWVTARPQHDVLAATIRATEAATAWHAISQRPGGSAEFWYVVGVGSYTRMKTNINSVIETILVDDLKHEYEWTVIHLHEARRNRVEIRPSKLADPKYAAQMREALTGTGILKAIQKEVGPSGVTTKMVVREGRRLRQLTDRKNHQQTFVDPRTDQIVMVEIDWQGNGTERVRMDYPDPASIDLGRFRFEIPRGACVVDRTGEPVRRRGGGEEAACAAQLKQIGQALRHAVDDNTGQWPDALLPAVEKFAGHEPLQCPLDPQADRSHVSYAYHRPSGALAEMAYQALNGTYAAEGREPAPILTRTVLLECRHHPGVAIRLYADGHTAREATTGK